MRGLPRPRAPAAMRVVCSASPRAPRPRGYPLRNVGCVAVAVSLRHPALRVCLWLRLEHVFEPCSLRLRRAIALTRLAILWLPGGGVKKTKWTLTAPLQIDIGGYDKYHYVRYLVITMILFEVHGAKGGRSGL